MGVIILAFNNELQPDIHSGSTTHSDRDYPSNPGLHITSIYPPTFAPPAFVLTSTSIPPTETETPTSTPTLELPTATSTSTLVPYDPNATPTPPPTIPSGYHTAAPNAYYSATPTGPAPTARPSVNTTAIQFTPSIDGDWMNGQMLKSPRICCVW